MYILFTHTSYPVETGSTTISYTRDYFAGHNNNNSSALAVYMNNNSKKQIRTDCSARL